MIHRYTNAVQAASNNTFYRSVEVCLDLPRKSDPRRVIRRCDYHGNIVPRVRMSKKDRLRLRKLSGRNGLALAA